MTWTWRGVVAGTATTPLGLAARDRPRIVPGPAPLGIECLGGPGHHMKRIGAADRGRATLGDHIGDPVRRVGGHMGDLGGPLGAQGIEKPAQGGGVTPWGGPHQSAAVVVDHHREVLVVALIRDLIDADPAQAAESIDPFLGVVPHPGHDRSHRAPGDPHQLTHRGFRTRHRQPRHRVIERVGVPGTVTRPRHRHHRRSMGGAVHPRRIGLQHHLHRAPVQAPPPTPALTPVIPGRLASTAATTPPHTTSRPHPSHHHRIAVSVFCPTLLELDVFDHGALVDTQQRTP